MSALSERLSVSTIHYGVRYRAELSRGGITSLLSPAACDAPLGSSWLTFVPDHAVVPADIDILRAGELAARVMTTAPAIPIDVVDQSEDPPDGW